MVVVNIHHIGSTSIPGLAAKPVINISLQVSSLAELDEKEAATKPIAKERMRLSSTTSASLLNGGVDHDRDCEIAIIQSAKRFGTADSIQSCTDNTTGETGTFATGD